MLTGATVAPDPPIQESLVRCLSNLALFVSSAHSSPPPDMSALDPAAEKELRAYALQLFLSLECKFLVGEVWCLNQRQSSTVAQSLVTLNFGGVMADVDISDVLRVLGSTLTSLPRERHSYQLVSHPSISRLIVRALDSTSVQSTHSAIKLLDHLGSIFEGDSDAVGVVNGIGDHLGCAVIRSWERTIAHGNTTVHDVTGCECLLRWITRSITADPSLATPFARSGVTHLFQLMVPPLSRELLGPQALNTQDTMAVTLLLGMLYTQTRMAINDALTAEECQALTQYVREIIPRLIAAQGTWTGDVATLTRQIVPLARCLIVRSTSTSAVGLEEACEALCREVKDHCDEN